MTSLADIQRHVGVAADGKWGIRTATAIAKALGMASPTAFDKWLPHILKHEGGYVNDPLDPGGATNKGVTQETYNDWRTRQGKPSQSVKAITGDEVSAIYRRDYWDKVKGDELPSGLAYAVFDFAVNSGVNRASRYLQRAVGVKQDGVIGPATIAACNALNAAAVINRLCDDRLAFLKQLPTFHRFGRGWTARVGDVRKQALAA